MIQEFAVVYPLASLQEIVSLLFSNSLLTMVFQIYATPATVLTSPRIISEPRVNNYHVYTTYYAQLNRKHRE